MKTILSRMIYSFMILTIVSVLNTQVVSAYTQHKKDQQLRTAVYNNDVGRVQHWIKEGAYTGCKENELGPLSVAAKNDYVEVAQLLIGSGAEVNPIDYYGPLFHAAYYGSINTARLLIQKGANVNSCVYGITPLHWAAKQGHVRMVRLLIESGAQINIKTNRGKTPLGLAQKYGRGEIVKLLQGIGATS